MKISYLFIGLLALIITQKGINMTRGIRNNNPMNIRESEGGGIAWDGELSYEKDEAFEEFESPEYGIRAGAKLLLNYQSIYGLNTINDIISRYAPSTENNTKAYASHAASALNVGINESIIVKDNLFELVSVIIKHENGFNPYSEDTIKKGIALV